MADIEWLVEQIEDSPEGPRIGAFFDFDGTVIAGYSALAFFKYRLKRREISPQEVIRSIAESINIERRGKDVDELMRVGVRGQAGRSAAEVDQWSRTVFAKELAEMIYPGARSLIEAHLRKRHTVVIASSATRPQIQPTADDLGVDYIVCTEMSVDDEGVYTGELGSDVRWGPGKAAAVQAFAERTDVDLAASFGYSNGSEDVPFLSLVGKPCALNPDEELAVVAQGRGWTTAVLKRPPETTPIDLVRSAAAGSVFIGTFGAAALLGLANRSRSLAANLTSAVGGELALAAAGVRVNVVGEENVWAVRPAVFTFNHQSQLDALILSAVLRKDFSAVAKKSLQTDPFFGPIGYLTEVVYIDRADTAKARTGLEGAVEALQEGKSIAIAPEGTRSPTPRLLPFKKGPFHLCMEAGVPMVPIVMRNCGEIMAAHSMVLHAGTVDVAVLPPVPTADWTRENLNEQVSKVRQMYLDTLADWPTEG
jgi:putative phosphoserine phosphatase/1-acylglycerol-3-phosphate O-acyltransferase